MRPWPVCLGLYALARMSWPVCLGLYVLACMSWPVCLGLCVLGLLLWFYCLGLPVRVRDLPGPNAGPQPHRGAAQRGAYHRRTALPGVGCRPMLGPVLGRSPASFRPTRGNRRRPTRARPWDRQARRADGDRYRRVSWSVLAFGLGRSCLLCWPGLILCLGRLSSPIAVVVGPCRGVVVMPPCLGGVSFARRA